MMVAARTPQPNTSALRIALPNLVKRRVLRQACSVTKARSEISTRKSRCKSCWRAPMLRVRNSKKEGRILCISLTRKHAQWALTWCRHAVLRVFIAVSAPAPPPLSLVPASPTAPKVHVAPGPDASTAKALSTKMCPRGDWRPRRVTVSLGRFLTSVIGSVAVVHCQ